MHAYIRKTLHEFDLRLTEVCAASHIDSALEKQREILRLIDTFSGILQDKNVTTSTLIEVNYHLKELITECIISRNHLGDFHNVYEAQSNEIIEQIQRLVRVITRRIKKSIHH